MLKLSLIPAGKSVFSVDGEVGGGGKGGRGEEIRSPLSLNPGVIQCLLLDPDSFVQLTRYAEVIIDTSGNICVFS